MKKPILWHYSALIFSNFLKNHRMRFITFLILKAADVVRPVARIKGGGVYSTPKMWTFLNPKSGLFEPYPLNPPSKTPFFGTLCDWKWTFGRYIQKYLFLCFQEKCISTLKRRGEKRANSFLIPKCKNVGLWFWFFFLVNFIYLI